MKKLYFKLFVDQTRNSVHGSDSLAASNREISFFFPEMITEPIKTGNLTREYLEQNVTPTLNEALSKLSKEKPADPCEWLANYLEKNNPNKPEIALV
jgi:hypothetical protein